MHSQSLFQKQKFKAAFFISGRQFFRKVQYFGLQNAYQNGEHEKHFFKLIVSLAFVQEKDVEKAFEELTSQTPEEFQPVVDYFEDTFIGRPQTSKRRPPLFSKTIWNVKQRLDSGLPKTNNHVEGWHRRIQSSVGESHPTLWKFLSILKDEQRINRIEMAKLTTGEPAAPQRNKYKKTNEKLFKISRNYQEYSILEYMKKISQCLNL